MKHKNKFVIATIILLIIIHSYLLFHYGCLSDEYNIVEWLKIGNYLWLGFLFSIITLFIISICIFKNYYKVLIIVWSIFVMFSVITIYQYYDFAKKYPLGVEIEYID